MDQFNLLELDNDVLNIIGDYVKKDNHDRIQKVCKKSVNLYEELDRNKELERFKNLKKRCRKKRTSEEIY